jgi:IMP dehydrogenase
VDPVTIYPEATVSNARELMETHNISGVPVVREGTKQLVGILTRRDLKFVEESERKVEEVMTSKSLVTASPSTTLSDAEKILHNRKVEKLLLVDDKNNLSGLITMRDIDKLHQFPHASRDDRGRLRVGAAVGVHDYERAEALIENEVDVLVVDTAHGHSKNVIETLRKTRKQWDIELIAGNVATADATRALIDAGVCAVKVGIGPGSICTTRVISGIGVPQLTAIFECSAAAGGEVPIIADGGIRWSGDMTKAIAAGASCVMIGSLFAGLDESPGETVIYKGRQFKQYRGMGSLGAMVGGSADRYGQKETTRRDKLVPEGVEGRVPYRGSLADFVYQLVGGLRAGLGYCGAQTITELQKKAKFLRVSPAAVTEGHPHNILITREAPNYSIEAFGGGGEQ